MISATTDKGSIRAIDTFVPEDGGRGFGPDHLQEFHSFNGGPHLCVEVDQFATISVNLSNGQSLTFAFIPTNEGDFECCDIHVHGVTTLENTDGRKLPAHHVMSFRGGCGTVDSRMEGKKTPVTLTAILLNRAHYEEEE
jgi:hypothetical protein